MAAAPEVAVQSAPTAIVSANSDTGTNSTAIRSAQSAGSDGASVVQGPAYRQLVIEADNSSDLVRRIGRSRVAERWHGWRWLCHIQRIDTEVDLTTVDRAVLIAIIAELQAVIERLQRRIAELEGQSKPGDPLRMPGLKATSRRKPPAQQQPRKQRRHCFARPRMAPTYRLLHVMENCPDCGAHRSGGWTQRTREVIELPVVPVQVTEHVYQNRTCPACRRRCTPPAVLDGVVLGQQRLGVNLLSLIATLREEGRQPIRSVQWYLDTVHQLRLSLEAIVSAIHQTAQRVQPAVAEILDRIRASPVVHADETGWRENRRPMATCGLSAPPPSGYFLRRRRGKAVVDEALSDAFSGVPVSDFYAAYQHYGRPQAAVLGPPAAGHPR